MNKRIPATLHTYLEAADIVLLSRGIEYRYEPYLHKSIFTDDPRETIIEKLKQANIIFLYSAGYDEWTDILIELQEITPLPVKLMILGGTDLIVIPEHMEIYEAFFPNTDFWIINFIGKTEKSQVIPLLFNWDGTKEFTKTEKKNLFGIPFSSINSIPRIEFYDDLKELPVLHPYLMKKMDNSDYYRALSSLYFCMCSMGNGPDTFRFWEALVCGAIPVVIKHPFFINLLQQYPDLPVVVIDTLSDLETILPNLTIEYYTEKMKHSNVELLWEEYWITKFKNYRTDQHSVVPERDEQASC